MEQNFKLGDYVYFIDNYNNNHEGEVFDVSNPLESMMVFILSKYVMKLLLSLSIISLKQKKIENKLA